MRIIRFSSEGTAPQLAALTDDEKVYPLPQRDFMKLIDEAEEEKTTPLALVEDIIDKAAPLEAALQDLNLLAPIDAPEVWAAGVTYEKKAGMPEITRRQKASWTRPPFTIKYTAPIGLRFSSNLLLQER